MGHKTIQVTLRYAHLAPQHQLEAVQRLCDTDSARTKATDTRTDTMPLESISAAGGLGPIKSCAISNYLPNARMAKSADAADLKSAGRKAVGVQVPLWAPWINTGVYCTLACSHVSPPGRLGPSVGLKESDRAFSRATSRLAIAPCWSERLTMS